MAERLSIAKRPARVFSRPPVGNNVRDISTKDVIEEVALPITALPSAGHDPMFRLAEEVFGERAPSASLEFARHWISTLYRVGAVGVKLQPTEPYAYSHLHEPVISPGSIIPQSKVRVHPMLHRALNILPNDRRHAPAWQ